MEPALVVVGVVESEGRVAINANESMPSSPHFVTLTNAPRIFDQKIRTYSK
jgi:hypothetical protein